MTDALDNPELLALDQSGMFGHIRTVGSELVRAWDASDNLALPAGAEKATAIVIAGVGGSATAGDYFATLMAPTSPIPVAVVRGYALPGYVSERTLVVVCSYSGNTEESLSAYADARAKNAPTLVISRGGELSARAAADGVPCTSVTYEAPPRATTVQTLAPLLQLALRLSLGTIGRAEVVRAGAMHAAFTEHDLGPAAPQHRNGAKQLAGALRGRVPLILGAEHLIPAADRFKNQLAENGKTLGAADSLPEAGHNLVVGLATGTRAAPLLSVVTLESHTMLHPRIQRGFDVIAEQFGEKCIPVHRFDVGGETPLEQLLWATALGDYTSTYLALLNGFDPTPIPEIEAFRKR